MSYVTEVNITHEFSGGSPVWTSALSITMPVGAAEVTVPALGATEYAVRTRSIDVFGNVSGWSSVVTHTTAAGSDGLIVTTATTALDVSDGVITLAKLASDASAALTAAQADATSALSQLTNIASDSLLSPVEKPPVIRDYAVITGEQAGIDAQATAYSVTTTKTAYDTAVSALTTYLGTLTSTVAWNTLTGDTTIVGSTFRSKFSDVYTTRQALLNAIYAAAKALADAAQSTASSAATAASTAQSTADGKNTAFYQTSAPSTTGRITGDLWFDTDDGYKMYVFSSGAWTASAFGNSAIGSLDAGKITTGVLDASVIGIKDAYGTTLLTGSGFSGSWASFIALGLYNAQFGAGVAGAIVTGQHAALPYWTVAQPDGASGALAYEAGPPPDVKATWGAISKRWSLTSDKVPVNANRFYEFGTYVTVNAPSTTVVDVDIQLNWYKADGTASAITPTVGPFESGFIGGLTSNVRMATGAAAPSDAAFAAVILTAKEATAHSSLAYCKFLMSWLSVTADTFSDVSATSLSAGSVSAPTGIFGAAQVTGLFETDALNHHGGTSFPGGAAANDMFYRTDYHRWYYFDGTRWLSVEEFSDHVTPNEAAQPWSATNAFRWGGWQGLTGVTDLWIVSINSTYFVASGGTALDASNKWVTTYAGMLGALSGTSQTIASGASNAWRSGAVLVGALLGTSEVGLSFTTTKTGTPGTLRQITRINYRLVAV